jgi:hypothetical protein
MVPGTPAAFTRKGQQDIMKAPNLSRRAFSPVHPDVPTHERVATHDALGPVNTLFGSEGAIPMERTLGRG